MTTPEEGWGCKCPCAQVNMSFTSQNAILSPELPLYFPELLFFYFPELSFYKVRLNRSWFMNHNEILNFHDWILCYHEPFHNKVKNEEKILMDWSMDLWHLNNVNFFSHKYANDHFLWTLWTLAIFWLCFFFLYWFFLYIVYNQTK